LDSLKILRKYIEVNQDVIDQFCERWQINKESFLESAFIAVYLHDIGKLAVEFQRNIRAGKASLRYPHAYYALSILSTVNLPDTLDVPLIAAVILGHHRQLSKGIYDNYTMFGVPSFLQKDIDIIVTDAKIVYQDLLFDRWFHFDGLTALFSNTNKKLTSLQHRQLRNKVKDKISLFEDKEKLKSVFCFLLSILKTCDCYSSAEFSEFIHEYGGTNTEFDSVIEEPEKYVLRPSTDLLYERILNANIPYTYQRDEAGKLCGDTPFFGLLFAPCGRGKTETALIWALKAAKKYRRNKIVFAMPTQITSNAMWERFCTLFGEGGSETEKIKNGNRQVGLFHGKSFIIMKDSQTDETESEESLDYESIEEVKSENFKGNVFFKPINVTTIDHLVNSFIHGFSQADFALGNLQNSVIVFDEVHYYEKQTMQHLMTLLELLKKMKIPTLLMSGTLPEFFVKKVRDINSEFQCLYSDDEGLLFRPFKILMSEEPLVRQNHVNEQVVKEIVGNYHHGLVQFVILNTIERSKAFYDALTKQVPEARDTIVLHNSQFTYKDRADKEKTLLQSLKDKKTRPFILVATQVIEISLDISCDIMYTELAPVDALGQRGGRLNRKGQIWQKGSLEYVMRVFITEELLDETPREKPYNPIILNNTKNAIDHELPYSYLKLKQLCDSVYADYKLTTPTNLIAVFRQCSLFGSSPYDINFGDEEKGREFQLRNDDEEKVDVIPWDCYRNETKRLDMEYQVAIPLFRFKQYKRNQLITKEYKNAKKWYWVAKIPYSKETGFDFGSL
jgi:CRISPR-associated endonuclease/helicase Cas3